MSADKEKKDGEEKPQAAKADASKLDDKKKEPTKETTAKEPAQKADGSKKSSNVELGGSSSTVEKTKRAFTVKKNWNVAVAVITAVKEIRKTIRKQEEKKEPDPFLARFTVTGRAYSSEEDQFEFGFVDFFTKKFWKEMVVDPSGKAYYKWSTLVMIAVLYNFLSVVLRCVFYQTHQPYLTPYWMCLDYVADMLNLWDMFVNSRIGFLEQGMLVRDIKRLMLRYMKSWKFSVDVLSILPFDLLYIVFGINFAFRLNKVLRIWRLVQFFHIAETRTNFPNLMRVGNLFLYIVMIIHWNACFYFAISRHIGFGTDGWVYADVTHPDHSSFWKQYLYSFYWSTLTLTTIGDTDWPEKPLELLVCIIDSLSGVLIFATILGNVGAMINNMNADRTEFQHKVDQVKAFMDLRGIGIELQNRVVKHFDYTWNNKLFIDDKQCLSALPDKLRAEISIHVHMNTLRQVAIFQDCEPGLLVELVLKLKLQVFSPGDYICRKGDIGKEMYIIKRGRLQVVSEDGKTVFVTMTDGTVFGEVSVLNIAGNKTGNRRTASVKSVGYSNLFCLSKNDLWEALEEYPEAKKMLMEKGRQILRKDKLLDEEAARREERRQQAMVTKVEIIVDTVDDIHKDLTKLSDKLESCIKPKSPPPLSSSAVVQVSPAPGSMPSVEEPERSLSRRKSSTTTPIKEETDEDAQ